MSIYEFHVTVDVNDFEPFKSFCSKIGVKALQIMFPHQPLFDHIMTSCTRKFDDVTHAYNLSNDIVLNMHRMGFTPLRAKIETIPTNPIIKHARVPDGYFESHIDVAVPSNYSKAIMNQFAMDNGLYISANRAKYVGSTPTLSFTCRSHNTTHEKFAKRVDDLEMRIRKLYKVIDKPLIECVLLDTNESHDELWIRTNLEH